MYSISYADESNMKHHVEIVKRPNIPSCNRVYEEFSVPGRGGKTYIVHDEVEDIEITIEFNFMNCPDKWMENFRDCKKWLLKKGINKLELSDDSMYFYKVKRVKILTAERVCYEIGKFEAVFYCYGHHYLKSGEFDHSASGLFNCYEISHPKYIIYGEGPCSLYVNGVEAKVDVAGNVHIDTDLMLTYREDGTYINTALTGDYEDLYLQNGENSVSVSEGFEVEIYPNWRCC